MEPEWIECRECGILPPEIQAYVAKTCGLCGTMNCDECLDEAGLCTPCSDKPDFSFEEAIPV